MALKTIAAPVYPRPESSAKKSPRAVPRGVREKDGCPVERFSLARDDTIDRNRTKREPPQPENGQETGQQNERATNVADMQRSVRKIRHRRPGRRRRDDDAPVEERTISVGGQLHCDHDHKN